MAEALTHARSLARTANDLRNPIKEFLASSEQFYFMTVFMALTELIIAARSDRELAKVIYPIIRKSRNALDDVWTQSLAEAGYAADHARQFIEMSHYLLRGVFFVSTWLPYKIDRAEVIRAWRELAPAVLRVKPRKRINGKCPRPRASRGVRMD